MPMRTDRSNNPIASKAYKPTMNILAQSGLKPTDFQAGDSTAGVDTDSVPTVKFSTPNAGYVGARAVLAGGQLASWYANPNKYSGATNVLNQMSQFLGKSVDQATSTEDFKQLPLSAQNDVVKTIYKHEGGSGQLAPMTDGFDLRVNKARQLGTTDTDILGLISNSDPDMAARITKARTLYGKDGINNDSDLLNYMSQKFTGNMPTVQSVPLSGQQGQQTQQQDQNNGASFPSQNNDSLLTSVEKGIGNVPSSVMNMAQGLGSAIMHPINTVENVGNAVSGGLQEGANAISGQQSAPNKQTQTFDAVINMFKNRYGSLDNLKKTLVNDPAGAALDLASILDAGGTAVGEVSKLGQASKIADLTEGLSGADKASAVANLVNDGSLGRTTQIAQGVSDVGSKINPINLAAKGISAVGSGLGRIGSDVMGIGTGVGGETIRQGLSAASSGGDAYDAFVQGLKGNVSPEDLVSSAQDALGEVIDNRNSSYNQMLTQLKNDKSVVDLTPVQNELASQLQKWNIKETGDIKEPLDFSMSKIASPADQNNIERIYNDIKSWKDLTPAGIDTLKQRISDYYSPNSKFRSMTSSLTSKTRDTLENAPGYSKEMKNYADATEWINETRKCLSLGDKAMTETAFKKLTSAFRQNNEWRAQALKELDDITGGQLKAKIAGQQMNSWVPRGLAKFGTGIEGAAALGSSVTGGAAVIPLLATMAVTSPKLVGIFLQGLGLASNKISIVMEYLNKANPGRIGEVVNAANKTNGLLPNLANNK